jgi:1-acyl-sn-glycerol-3-phosphate acyltransferase
MLRMLGWRIEGSFPNVPKAVIIAAPHTSNWDGAITLATVLAMRLNLSWMGKNSMFRWPFGRLLRWMGGIPIDRTATRGVVQASIDAFKTNESLLMVIAPEGTRAAVAGEWKLGFYPISSGAALPFLQG